MCIDYFRSAFTPATLIGTGETYRGSHEPLISTALFERVQEILEGRYSTKEKVTKHEFAFTGIVNCGHCGCALVAEKKKGKYVYYHCTGNKGKCPEPYAREEGLEACFADLLKGFVFDDQVMDWIVDAFIRATQTRNDLDVMRLLAYKTNKARFRIGLISSTMIGLMDLSSLISLNVRQENGDKLSSV